MEPVGHLCGLRPVSCHSLVKYKMLNQEQLWSVLIARVTAWKNQTLKHIIEERFYIWSVWYLKQTICFLTSVRIREGRFSMAGFIFFGKEWQAKIRLDPENFKGSIRNRQQILLCVFLPKPSLQSFQLFSLAIWDLSSPSPCAFLPFPLLVAVLWPHFCLVTKYESPVTSPLPTRSFFHFSPSLIMYLTHTSLLGDLQAVSLFVPLWDKICWSLQGSALTTGLMVKPLASPGGCPLIFIHKAEALLTVISFQLVARVWQTNHFGAGCSMLVVSTGRDIWENLFKIQFFKSLSILIRLNN